MTIPYFLFLDEFNEDTGKIRKIAVNLEDVVLVVDAGSYRAINLRPPEFETVMVKNTMMEISNQVHIHRYDDANLDRYSMEEGRDVILNKDKVTGLDPSKPGFDYMGESK